jgi:hypothetical protein
MTDFETAWNKRRPSRIAMNPGRTFAKAALGFKVVAMRT